MTNFWAIALLMVAVAMLFVLWPLVRRSTAGQDAVDRDEMVLDLFNEHLAALDKQLQQGDIDESQHAQLKQELELGLLDDSVQLNVVKPTRRGGMPLLLGSLSLALLVLSSWFYYAYGAIEDVEIQQLSQQKFHSEMMAAREGREVDPTLAQELLEKLRTRVAAQADNDATRYLLARTAAEQGQYLLALKNYSLLIESNPKAANILAETAQVVFLASENRITPEVDSLISRALDVDPYESTALGLAGISAFNQQDFAGAMSAWQRALSQLPPQSGAAQVLLGGIEHARQQLLATGGELPVSEAQSGESKPAAVVIELEVSLPADAQLSADAVVFIYARAWQGPKMPLAISRMPAANLPAKVTLTEAMAMTPAMTIASFEQLELVARVSQSGTPEPQSGDMEVTVGPVSLADLDGAVELRVDQIIP